MPSPWITRMVRDEDGSVADPRDFAPEPTGDKGLHPRPTRCQTINCRVREQRQDLQCIHPIGHPGRHLRTIALGYCEARFADLIGPGSGGRKGGHTNPVL